MFPTLQYSLVCSQSEPNLAILIKEVLLDNNLRTNCNHDFLHWAQGTIKRNELCQYIDKIKYLSDNPNLY